MGVTNFLRLGNKLIGERPLGGSLTNYATDALGSVTGTLVAGALQNTYTYQPYGQVLQNSGVGLDPFFTWVGAWGYKPTLRKWSEFYVRARTYSYTIARWLTRDPLWPSQSSYSYVSGRPSAKVDPSGLACADGQGPDCCGWIQKYRPMCTPLETLGCTLLCAESGCIPFGCWKLAGECGHTCACLILGSKANVNPQARSRRCFDDDDEPEPTRKKAVCVTCKCRCNVTGGPGCSDHTDPIGSVRACGATKDEAINKARKPCNQYRAQCQMVKFGCPAHCTCDHPNAVKCVEDK